MLLLACHAQTCIEKKIKKEKKKKKKKKNKKKKLTSLHYSGISIHYSKRVCLREGGKERM